MRDNEQPIDPFERGGSGRGRQKELVELSEHSRDACRILANDEQLARDADSFAKCTIADWDATVLDLSLIHISEPTRLGMISYAVFCRDLHLSIRRQRQMCIRDRILANDEQLARDADSFAKCTIADWDATVLDALSAHHEHCLLYTSDAADE